MNGESNAKRWSGRAGTPVSGLDALERLADKDILESIIGIKPGDHICAYYDYSPIEHMAAIVAYLKEGLVQGEQCVYVADETPAPLLERWLKAEDVDIASEQERGALLIWTREEWREPGPLDSIRKAAQVRQILEAAFAAGFRGVRFAVEMTWTLEPDVSAEDIEDWEATSTRLMASGVPITAMCLYGRKRLSTETLDAGLRTHPLVLDSEGLRENEDFAGASD